MTQQFELPLLDDIEVKNPATPLYVVFWSHLNQKAFEIRQELSKPIKTGGINKNSMQNEVTTRAVVSIKLNIPYTKKTQASGISALIKQTMNIVNLKLFGTTKPIKELKLCRTNRDLLCYYGKCYHNNIELVIYIGSWEDIDEADFLKRERSKVTNRNWKIIAQQLPISISAKQK